MSAKVASAKKPSTTKATEHPSVAVMVDEALADLADNKGSSRIAIKKYISANFKGIEMTRAGPLINRYLKKAVIAGAISQRKGSFTSGNEDAKKPKAKKAATVEKVDSVKKTKTPKKGVKKAGKTPIKKAKSIKTPTKKPAAKKLTKKPAPKKLTKK